MRYHFNIRDFDTLIRDDEGTECTNFDVARQEAFASARDFASNDIRCGGAIFPIKIEITDQRGKILESVSVREVIIQPIH